MPFAQRLDSGVGRFAFSATILAQVVADAVVIALTIGFIVLAVIRDEIVEREPVVAGDEVDAVGRQAAPRLIEARASCDGVGDQGESCSSKRSSSTPVASPEKWEKLTPFGKMVAPRG